MVLFIWSWHYFLSVRCFCRYVNVLLSCINWQPDILPKADRISWYCSGWHAETHCGCLDRRFIVSFSQASLRSHLLAACGSKCWGRVRPMWSLPRPCPAQPWYHQAQSLFAQPAYLQLQPGRPYVISHRFFKSLHKKKGGNKATFLASQTSRTWDVPCK